MEIKPDILLLLKKTLRTPRVYLFIISPKIKEIKGAVVSSNQRNLVWSRNFSVSPVVFLSLLFYFIDMSRTNRCSHTNYPKSMTMESMCGSRLPTCRVSPADMALDLSMSYIYY
jgi:hypothetical protein